MVVQIVIGSKADLEVAKKASEVLKKLGIEHRISIASAHRTPDLVASLAEAEDVEIFIAIAGLAAALPGAIAAHTTKPVIGVPVSGKVNLDSMLSMLQMPKGMPVATVGLDSGENAALLAAEILALSDPKIADALREYRHQMRQKILQDNEEIERSNVQG
jgi:5-(carboxyamino)imidazole ribonucleotide mutase